MGNPKKIYCPKCGRFTHMTYDGHAHNNLSVRCKKCDVLVTYYFESDTTDVKPVPERGSIAGCRFY